MYCLCFNGGCMRVRERVVIIICWVVGFGVLEDVVSC